jgi:5-methylcytosine-specific restriction endonuclease McrA
MKGKKGKKQSIRSLVTKADRLIQEVLVRQNPHCLVCGHRTSEMHHFVPKSQSNNLRYDEINLVPLCRGCHFRHHSAGDPTVVATILDKNGMGWFDELQKRRKIICKFNRVYLENIIRKFDK